MLRTLLIVSFVLLAVPAAAQAAGTTVDLGPLVNWAIALIGAVIVPVIIFYLQKFTGIQLSNQSKATIESALNNGIALATSKIAPTGITVDVKNAVIADAARYVLEHAPEAAKKFGLDTDPAKLAEKIEARLVQTPAAAPVSPATAIPAPTA